VHQVRLYVCQRTLVILKWQIDPTEGSDRGLRLAQIGVGFRCPHPPKDRQQSCVSLDRSALHPIRILLVDDHGIVRDGLTALLERDRTMQVVGAVATGTQAVRAAARLKPSVVVMDLMLPELSGIDATERILTLLPRTRIVVLSVCRSSEHIFRALRAGAHGYVLKDAAGSELVRAVLAVMAGGQYFSPQIAQMAAHGMLNNTGARSPLDRLSRREREVLHLTVAGSSSAEIAQRLSLSKKTVDTYRSRVMEKLGVPDLTRLIHFAIEHAMTPV
jgi:DNA-binding NarL/FixJ family response regulator